MIALQVFSKFYYFPLWQDIILQKLILQIEAHVIDIKKIQGWDFETFSFKLQTKSQVMALEMCLIL
jgi:hypothetical protein